MLWIYALQIHTRYVCPTRLFITSSIRRKIVPMLLKTQKTLYHHSHTLHRPQLHPIPSRTQTPSLRRQSNHLTLLSSSNSRHSKSLMRHWNQWSLGYLPRWILTLNLGICPEKCGQTTPNHSRLLSSTGCCAPPRFAVTCSRD